MRKPLALLLLSAACLYGYHVPANPLIKPFTEISSTTNTAYTGTYKGVLPCADCKGIEMELTLLLDGKSKSKQFILKQKYIGKSTASNAETITGKWFMATGNKQNPKAKILQLIPDTNSDLLYFELMKDGSIKLLDRGQEQYKSKLNYTLRKQNR